MMPRRVRVQRAEIRRLSPASSDRAGALWRKAVYQLVNRRDEGCCRPCGRYAGLDLADDVERGHPHHLHNRSQGGQDSTRNVCVICRDCHRAVHTDVAHRLTITGNADSTLTFTQNGRTWHHAPGQERTADVTDPA